jgi:uncharacterized protein
MTQIKPFRQKAAEIIRDAGGRIVGRTRLQKVAFLLELAGLGDGFRFEYKHYGPYSEELAEAIGVASLFGLVRIEDHPANWGGWYSTYEATPKAGDATSNQRSAFAREAAKVGAVELELAATAAYLAVVEGYSDPWRETARLKPEKAAKGRLESAKGAYRALMKLDVPHPLPKIV